MLLCQIRNTARLVLQFLVILNQFPSHMENLDVISMNIEDIGGIICRGILPKTRTPVVLCTSSSVQN